MKTAKVLCAVMIGIAAVSGGAQHNGSGGYPIPPELLAIVAEIGALVDQGEEHLLHGRLDEAILSFTLAAEKEDALRDTRISGTKYRLAKALTLAGREEEALAAYRRAFWWDATKQDLTTNGPPQILLTMDYAMLLSKRGQVEEAKAIYYFGLRHFNGYYALRHNGRVADGDRNKEPIPFLIVFDPDPEGIYWEYSPERLKAAALMAKAQHTEGESKALLEQARQLVPDSFYPIMFQLYYAHPTHSALLAQAEALARPGLERDLVAKYRADLEEHRLWMEANDYRVATDTRPMTEGNVRRARMTVLVPDEAMLKRLSLGGSG